MTDQIREAREVFCRDRRHPDHFMRWLSWTQYRAALEGWHSGQIYRRDLLLSAASQWKSGARPPTTYGQAAAQSTVRPARGEREAAE